MVTKKRKLILIMGTVFCLAGCVSTPRQEPFGEETFSEAEAASAYETVSESMAQAEFENMGGYTVSVSGAFVKVSCVISSAISSFTDMLRKNKKTSLKYS